MAKSRTNTLVLASIVVVALGILAGCGEAEKAPSADTKANAASSTSVKEEGKQGGMVPDFSIDK
ncbi:MAG: hypothetical protein AB7F50_06275 [Fimbriimonadaceae bacterium]